MRPRRSAAAWLAAALLLAACAGAGSGATPSVELAAASPTEMPSPSPTDSPRAAASHDMSLEDEYGDGGEYGGGSESSGGSGSSSTGEGGTATVMMMGYEFSEDITVAAGTVVTFLNHDGGAHTVTEGTDGVAAADAEFDEEVAAGGSVDVTFDEPGTYNVTCLIHPTMNLVITVEG